MPDAHKSARQHVQKKAAQKFLDGQRHQALLVFVGRVAPTEGDAALGQRDQSVIGDRYAMGVTAQIAQCLFGSAERTLGIDHPIGAEQRAEPGGERWGRLERGGGAGGGGSPPETRSLRWAGSSRGPATNLPRKTRLRTLTGRKNPYGAEIQRWWSALSPPAGTTQ